MILKLGKDAPPKKGTCATCVHFKPEIVHTHKGRPLTAWHGFCVLHPDTRYEQTHSCPCWAEK